MDDKNKRKIAMDKKKRGIALGMTLLICSLIFIGSIIFKRPTYKQITTLQENMTVKEVIYKLGRVYRDVGSGTKSFSYMLRDRQAAAILTFYQDKLVNVIIHYETGEVEFIIRPDYIKAQLND